MKPCCFIWELLRPKQLTKNFNLFEGKAKIVIFTDRLTVKFGKKAFNQMIIDWVRSLAKWKVPWMGNRLVEYAFY